MLIAFKNMLGKNIAVNPEFIISVVTNEDHTNINVVCGSDVITFEVTDDFHTVFDLLNGIPRKDTY